MYPDTATSLNTSSKKFTRYSMMLVLFAGLSFFMFYLPQSPLYQLRQYFNFLIFPTIAILAGASIKNFVNCYFAGRWTSIISSAILHFANGIAMLLFLAFVTKNMKFMTSLIWVLLLVVSIIMFRASKFFYIGIYEECTIKAFSYILMGVSIKSMFGRGVENEFFSDEFWTSITNNIMISFTILAILQMATLVELFYTAESRRISMWFKTKHLLKYIYISSMVFVLTDLRRGIMGDSASGLWIFLFMVLVVTFIVLAAKLWGNVKNTPEEKLAKHIQDMNFDNSKDLENVSRYIEEYVNYGKKSKLVAYMTFLGYKTGIPFNAVSNIIAPLVEYSDPEITSIVTSEQYKAIEERNQQNRTIVVEKITSNLQLFGKGVYGYNGYSTSSETMQKYN